MPGLSQGRSVVVIGCDDAEGPSFFRLRIDAPLKRALHQLAGSTLIHFSVDEVMTVLVRPAAIAIIVDLLETPPLFFDLATTMAYPWVDAKPFSFVSLSVLEVKMAPTRAAGGG